MRWASLSLSEASAACGGSSGDGCPREYLKMCVYRASVSPAGGGRKVAGREGRPQAAPMHGSQDASFLLGPAPPSGLTSGT